MLLRSERKQVVDFGRKMIAEALVKGTGGNLSICHRERNLVAISPGAMDYYTIQPEDVVVVDFDGNIVESVRKPSSEIDMHLGLYRNRPDISAVIHTHSVCAAALSCLRQGIPPVHYLVGFAGRNVRCAEYATYGTKALADNVLRAMADRNAALLANHGLIAAADSLAMAYTIAEMIEYCADIYLKIKSPEAPVIIDNAEMDRVIAKFRDYVNCQ